MKSDVIPETVHDTDHGDVHGTDLKDSMSQREEMILREGGGGVRRWGGVAVYCSSNIHVYFRDTSAQKWIGRFATIFVRYPIKLSGQIHPSHTL